MQIKFKQDLDFQNDAINSTVDLFKSQKFIHESLVIVPENGTIPNILDISESQILENLNTIQQRNDIELSKTLEGMNFSIEMETGTGKTYVYLRTIFELFKNYGFKKFIILVPTVAIREGVLKNLRITESHMRELYSNTPYNYYEYDSKKLHYISNFARGTNIEILVVTKDSINKDTNIMNQENDSLRQKPIELLQKTNPILILDEPQNMETEILKQSIDNLNPLCTLRYSATHKNVYNLAYRLTPVDAYRKNLVKRIEVLSVIKEGDFNNAFVRCLEIKAEKRGIKTKLEVNKKSNNGYKLTKISVKGGDDLFEKSENKDYSGFVITEINAKNNYVTFSNGIKVKLGEETGDDRIELMKIQIEQTIKEHFEKSEKLRPLGIKVLSLFFIDRVDNYRLETGFIRQHFEKTFEKLKKDYPLFKDMDLRTVHNGYFSERKTDKLIEIDKDAYDKILRDKEKLLSIDEPLQFIFSHSALKEGWDNPNVFNICTLNKTQSTMKKRQEIGRGLRLPVNQLGERVLGEQNVLTVLANENYADYASQLQNEYIEEYGEGGEPPIKNARNRRTLKLKKGFELNPEFVELWKKIGKKTKYEVSIDVENLVKECVEQINEKIKINSIRVKIESVALSLEKGNQVNTNFLGYGETILEKSYPIPNLVDYIGQETNLTRKTIVKILSSIKNLDLIFKDPQEFVSSVTLIIKEKLADFLVNGIKYLEMDDWYKMKLFKDIETYEDLIVPVSRTIYDGGIKKDSDVEKDFAESLEKMNFVKLFIKLPSEFVVDTPIGNYNPDWAIVIDDTDQFGKVKERLYLVTETKGDIDPNELRGNEKRKITCATKHFETIDVPYKVVNDAQEILIKS